MLSQLALNLLRKFDPEDAHGLTINALKLGLGPCAAAKPDPILAQKLWGLDFKSPLGMAAGFDKNAEVPLAVLKLGFGFTEVGSITPKPQAGNPRPRLFRLPEDRAIINRMGFNNLGMEVAFANLQKTLGKGGIIGVNLGKNKETVDAAADYALVAAKLAPLASYLVINVSSPNTPGLRTLQNKAILGEIIRRVRTVLPANSPPLLFKIAPDLDPADLEDIAALSLEENISGIIATNTTISRPETLNSAQQNETGGLSGEPLFTLSTQILARLYKLTQGRIPLIGAGGISSPEAAYAKIKAGASLLQLYSALVYKGPGLATEINQGLAALLKKDGFTSITQAVGADNR